MPKSNDIHFASNSQWPNSQFEDQTADWNSADGEQLQQNQIGEQGQVRTIVRTQSKALILALPIMMSSTFAGFEPGKKASIVLLASHLLGPAEKVDYDNARATSARLFVVVAGRVESARLAAANKASRKFIVCNGQQVELSDARNSIHSFSTGQPIKWQDKGDTCWLLPALKLSFACQQLTPSLLPSTACSIRLIVPRNMRILAKLTSRRLTFAAQQVAGSELSTMTNEGHLLHQPLWVSRSRTASTSAGGEDCSFGDAGGDQISKCFACTLLPAN